MYRINLYPEFGRMRREGRARALRAGALGLVLGLEVCLFAGLVVSGFLLMEKVHALRSELPKLESRLKSGGKPAPGQQWVQAMARLRVARVDWSPKLAELSRQIDPSLQLSRVSGRANSGNNAAKFEIEGTVRGGGKPLQQVSGFMARLRGDAPIARDFPVVDLGTMGGKGTDQFKVTCAQGGGTP